MIRLLLVVMFSTVVGRGQDTARMDEVVKAQATGDRFMGSVLVAKDGDVVFARSYGLANREWKIPHTAATKFRIGSVTKQFTAAAILLLEERGRLKTDEPLSKFIPTAPAAWRAVTLHQLLTHTSGVPSFTEFPDYGTWKLSPQSPADIMALMAGKPLDFPPGEKFKYSNTGYVLLGWIIEKASGQTYETFLREQIFKPLAMDDTGYDSNSTVIPERAAGYMTAPGGVVNAPYIDMHVPGGAGGLYSTTADLARWLRQLFAGKLLSAASLEKMTTPMKENYACGVFVATVNGRKSISHSGGIEGFNSHVAYYPESKVAVVVLSNVTSQAPSEIATQLAALAFGEAVTLAAERVEVEVPVAVLQRYVGVYQLLPQVTNTIRVTDGRLTTQLAGQRAFPLFAESEKKFFLKVVNAQVEFGTDEQGRVTHLTQTQGGRAQKAPRISDTVVERKAIDLPRATLESYVGFYEATPALAFTVTLEGDQLMSQPTGQAKAPMFAEAEGKFFLRLVDAQVEFFKGTDGAVTHLILHQGARDLKATRKR